MPPVKRGHFAALTDPKKGWPVAEMSWTAMKGSLIVRCALRLAPLVFVRPGELRRAEWSGIDLEAADWRFTVTKTGILSIWYLYPVRRWRFCVNSTR